MKDKLRDYIGKNVKLIDNDDLEYIGRLVYLDDDKLNNRNESFYQVKTFAVGFDIVESEVKSIKEVELNSESLRLWEYEGKRVRVIDRDGDEFEGKVVDFDDELDNATGYDSIYLKTDTGSFGINEYEIKSIKEIE
ncbi:hypothetical protein [Staphylococcus gallinarum]|uniref:hypothetical protein n=1 Tax=Staphylococcus gallinarum TaxID=1293 RepID=UPI001E3EF955|nr:hypothetical protein [Staphylococcus gallinarum]